ncbi:MAG: RdgB/HAM1 family non-canonical purine NTP pyrophosphatase [Alphaproteobacteria bacterium]
MARRFTGDRLVIASHNAGKLREIAALMAPFGVDTESAAALGLPEPEETGATFVENAELKARAAALATGAPALSDDSGLVVDALGGAPGIHSARWAETGAGRDFTAAMAKVEAELGDNPDRRAHFTATLSLAWPDGHCESFQGQVHGALVFPARGAHGFGYDPIFQPEGYDITFGEMDTDGKHAISHRAVAFAQLIEACFGTPS